MVQGVSQLGYCPLMPGGLEKGERLVASLPTSGILNSLLDRRTRKGQGMIRGLEACLYPLPRPFAYLEPFD